MKHYYVNDSAQLNGDHEVHTGTCYYLPQILNKTYLGIFMNAIDATKKAKMYHVQSNGCAYCCPEANTD